MALRYYSSLHSLFQLIYHLRQKSVYAQIVPIIGARGSSQISLTNDQSEVKWSEKSLVILREDPMTIVSYFRILIHKPALKAITKMTSLHSYTSFLHFTHRESKVAEINHVTLPSYPPDRYHLVTLE